MTETYSLHTFCIIALSSKGEFYGTLQLCQYLLQVGNRGILTSKSVYFLWQKLRCDFGSSQIIQYSDLI